MTSSENEEFQTTTSLPFGSSISGILTEAIKKNESIKISQQSSFKIRSAYAKIYSIFVG